MTTIIFLEQQLQLSGVTDATERLVNFHTHAVQARFQRQLEERLVNFQPIKLAEKLGWYYPLEEYKAQLEQLEKEHSLWSIRDDRVLLFLAEFAKMVKEARLLWVDLERSRTEFEKELQKLNREAFNKFSGPKLHLTSEDSDLALRFVNGENVAEEQPKRRKGEAEEAATS